MPTRTQSQATLTDERFTEIQDILRRHKIRFSEVRAYVGKINQRIATGHERVLLVGPRKPWKLPQDD